MIFPQKGVERGNVASRFGPDGWDLRPFPAR
jgi:hypothetical protein